MNKNVNIDKPKTEASVKIESLSHDGRGIATIGKKKTFLAGGLPGETVTYSLIKKRSHYNEGKVLSIDQPSAARSVPPCPHADLCGGCSLQHMNMDTQLALKQQTLLNQLKHFGNIIPENILPPLDANHLGYRRKARLGVKFVIKKNKLLVGFREKASRYLADLNSCAVLHPHIGKRFNELRQLIQSLAGYQHIPQVEIAMGDDEMALIFRTLETLSASDVEKLIAFGKNYNFHIYLQPNSKASVYPIWPGNRHARLRYALPQEQLEILFHPLDFTQINLEMNRLMLARTRELLDIQAGERVLDLFCGIGNFSLPLARHAAHVTGIEGEEEMVSRARENARHNQINNVSFHAANLAAPDNQAAWLKNQTYHKILLDPPRVGAQEILSHFAQFRAKKIVYVSCNPATLARDARILGQQGYQLTHAGIMNMFPHTTHVEAIAVFVE